MREPSIFHHTALIEGKKMPSNRIHADGKNRRSSCHVTLVYATGDT